MRGFHIDGMLMKAMYRIAIPAILMQSIMSFMTVMMNMILAPFSEMAVSVFSIYYKLQQFVFMAVLGMNNALIPISLQLRCQSDGTDQGGHPLCALDVLCHHGHRYRGVPAVSDPAAVYFLMRRTLLSIGIPALRTISVSFVFAGISMVLCSVFQALGSPNHSLLVTLLRQMVILLPLAYGFSSAFGLDMCWWSFPIAEVLSARFYRCICCEACGSEYYCSCSDPQASSLSRSAQGHSFSFSSSRAAVVSMPIAPSGALIRMDNTATESTISPQASPMLSGSEPMAACTVAFGR